MKRKTSTRSLADRGYPAGRFSGGLLLLILAGGCGSVLWEPGYEPARQKAVREQRRLLVAFVSGFNEDCGRMDREVLADGDIRRLIGEYVPVRLDTALHPRLAEQYGVDRLPAFYIVRPDGSVAGCRSGVMDVETFRAFLIRNRYE